MKRSIVEIYAMAVCFICAAVSAVSVTVGVYNVVEIANPEFTMSSFEYLPHQNNEAFLEYKLTVIPEKYGNPYEHMSHQELTSARERSFRTALEKERRNASQGLLRCLIVIGVLALIFAVHWRIGKRQRRDAAPAAG